LGLKAKPWVVMVTLGDLFDMAYGTSDRARLVPVPGLFFPCGKYPPPEVFVAFGLKFRGRKQAVAQYLEAVHSGHFYLTL